MTEPSSAPDNRLFPRLSYGRGFALCFLWGLALKQIIDAVFLSALGEDFIPILLGLTGAYLYGTRARKAIDLGLALTVVILIAIGYTPLIHKPALRWIQTDSLVPCPAVIVLSSEVWQDQTLNASGQDRLIRSLELIHRNYAKNLVITRIAHPSRSSLPTVKIEMADLGIKAPIFQVGPVKNTHDEALKVAELARARHWTRIILVTSPIHTRRARAVFAKTGLAVVVQSSAERRYDLVLLEKTGDRYELFRDWLKEMVGYKIYQARGWI